MGFKDLWNLIRQAVSEWSEDKAPRLAAALAYYTVFAIPPLLVTVIGIAGWFFGRRAAEQAIKDQIATLLNPRTAEAIGEILESAGGSREGGIAAIVGAVVLLVSASGVFGQLQDALNTIWEVRPKPGQGIRILIRKRLFSMALVLVLGFLLLVSMVLSAVLSALSGIIEDWLPGYNLLYQITNFLLPFIVFTLLFALMFKYVPDVVITWRDVWLGAVITSLLFNLGKTLIGLYLARSNPASAFGAAASVVLILLWVYYTAQILLFGAEVTKVYASRYGSGIVPEEYAEKVTETERAQQGIPHIERRPDSATGVTYAPGGHREPGVTNQAPYAPNTHLSADKRPQAEGALANFITVVIGLVGVVLGLFLGRRILK